jgi:hypothetical protein
VATFTVLLACIYIGQKKLRKKKKKNDACHGLRLGLIVPPYQRGDALSTTKFGGQQDPTKTTSPMPRVEPTAPFEEPLLVAPTGRTRSRLALGSLLVLGLAMVGVVAVVITTTHGHSGSHGDDHKNDDAPTPRQEIEHSNLTEAFAAWHEIYKPDSMYQSGQQMQSKIKIFGENMAKVDAHNARYAKGEVSFNMTLGPFADMTSEQFVNRFLVKLPPSDPSLPIMPDLEETLGGTAHKGRLSHSGTHIWHFRQCHDTVAALFQMPTLTTVPALRSGSPKSKTKGRADRVGHSLPRARSRALGPKPARASSMSRRSKWSIATGNRRAATAACPAPRSSWSPPRASRLRSNTGNLSADWSFAPACLATASTVHRYQGTDYLKCKAQKYSNKGMVHGPVKVPQSDTKLYTALQTHGPVSVAIDATVLQHYHSG